MSGLICGENSNPLAVFALTAEGTRIHVMSWPNLSGAAPAGQPRGGRFPGLCADEQGVRGLRLRRDRPGHDRPSSSSVPRRKSFWASPDCCGGSVIVAPNSRIIAGPLGAEEGILYAECDIETGIQMKLRHDFAGHYNRPDIFQLRVNNARPHIYDIHGTRQPEALPDAQRAALESYDDAGQAYVLPSNVKNTRAVIDHGRSISNSQSGRGAGGIGVPRPRGIDRESLPPDPRGRQKRRARDCVSRGIHPDASGLVSPPSRDQRDRQQAGRGAVQELGRDSRA